MYKLIQIQRFGKTLFDHDKQGQIQEEPGSIMYIASTETSFRWVNIFDKSQYRNQGFIKLVDKYS
jgi:hypothetical protein